MKKLKEEVDEYLADYSIEEIKFNIIGGKIYV